MTATLRVHVTHHYEADPATVFAALSEHENLGPLFGADITRVRDGDDERNGVGSTRRLKIGLLPAFEESVTRFEQDSLIEYRISRGSPLVGHWGAQRLTPTATGTRLDYRVAFDSKVPGLAALVAVVLDRQIPKGLARLL